MNPRTTSGINVGDRVVVRAVSYRVHDRYVGRVGIVNRIIRATDWIDNDAYGVDVDGSTADVRATRVDVVPAPPVPADPTYALDGSRVDAARFAHTLLGTDADIADVIDMATFVLATAPDAPKPAVASAGGPDVAAAIRNTSNDFRSIDAHRDAVSMSLDPYNDRVTLSATSNSGSDVTSWMSPVDIDRAIAFLTDARTVINNR